MPDVNATREALAVLVAESLGLGDPSTLDAGQQAIVDRKVEALADEGEAPPAHWRDAIQAYRDARRLRADEAHVRLAEQGEVFAPEDDA